MLGWLKKLFTRSRPSGEETLSPPGRVVYSYWNGVELKSADPVLTWRRLWAGKVDLATAVKIFSAENLPGADRDSAWDEMVVHCRDVFGIPPFDQGGLTEGEILALLWNFTDYIQALKKKQGTIQNSSQPTDSPSLVETSPMSSESGLN